MKRRRLADLWITGRPCRIENADTDSFEEFWLQKPSLIDQESCLRRANAARARTLMFRGDEGSEEWRAEYSGAIDLGDRNAQVSYLIGRDLVQKRDSIEAELATKEPWSKDDYLQGLIDAWEGEPESPGFKDRYAEEPEDPEAKKCFEELKRFDLAVEKKLDPERKALEKDFDSSSDEEIRRKVADRFLESQADSVWMRELNRSELFYAVRMADDHTKRYFERIDEIEDLPVAALSQLVSEYRMLTVEMPEGKDSRETDDSSSSSDQPATVEVDSSSGPLSVVR